ncbi:hypothetical protein GTW36_23495 [Vibrio parahaemolyticus]|nr:hypothetical protein [Vibrio parahaemolyticus]EGQ9050238.1 hypothetical protein [Vibrio parahaemolyticus]EGQ9589487.1 hypothetical protein [Vibrio parahaemolyticus]EGR1003060.1 hypothetical protein [Vibrio parahaemolyticus]EGR1304351.1 hypothetical protein [Vibrio parahaemolyticus]
MATNAALRGEQRDTTQLKPLCHKHKSSTLNQNCQALRIPLKRFVMAYNSRTNRKVNLLFYMNLTRSSKHSLEPISNSRHIQGRFS